jgi:3-phenylpropionate/trans-cinnamate dioxygenase ferredoxin subunit
MADLQIKASKNGPFLVLGQVEIVDENGKPYPTQQTAALCRCGASSKKPFCDGTHRKINFQS